MKTEANGCWKPTRNLGVMLMAVGSRLSLDASVRFRVSCTSYCLILLGEGFEEGGEYINGAVVQIRKRVDRLQLWTAEIPEPTVAVSLGRQFKRKLNIPDGLKVPRLLRFKTLKPNSRSSTMCTRTR